MSSNLNADNHPNTHTAATNQSDSASDQPVLAGAAESATEPSEEDGLADSNNNRTGHADDAKAAGEQSANGTNFSSNAANIGNCNSSSGGNSSSKQNKVERIRECINQCLR